MSRVHRFPPARVSKDLASRNYERLLGRIQERNRELYSQVESMNRKDAIKTLLAAGGEIAQMVVFTNASHQRIQGVISPDLVPVEDVLRWDGA